MPQLFQVLRCCKCLVFQVHQTKKSNKFQCKMCGEKQSVKRHYGLGNGQECRVHVQKLNGIRGNLTEQEVVTSENLEEEFEHNEYKMNSIQKLETSTSKWSAFVNDEENVLQDENAIMHPNNEVMLFENRKRRKKCIGSQETSIRKFETPYKCKEKIHLNIHHKSNQETSEDFESEEKCNELINNLDNVHDSVKGKSKWEQFVEHKEKIQEMDETLFPKNSSILFKTNNLFELCDESDFDNILNI